MPYTGIVLTIVALHAAAFLILLGHWLAAAGLFPKAVEAFARQYRTRPVRATLLGIFTYGPLFLLLLNSAKIGNPLIKLIAVFGGFGVLLLAFIGSAGLALQIGCNLSPGADRWAQARRGGVALALVFITPVLGSLFLLHIGLASGFGALLLARPWQTKPSPELPPPPATDTLQP
ncbi:MAG: hypothetical protein K9N23_11820 [Akkermansiaceae bacterium]|nr:hypothetical protein [Akkermansiaceae bacterium]MCF7732372.1 hypothetical protein [Akkermansiaceae bacterium]